MLRPTLTAAILTAALAVSAHAGDSATDGQQVFNGMIAPKFNPNTPMGLDYGDNFGNHTAERSIDMNGMGIFNLMDVDPGLARPDQAVNRRFVEETANGAKDNLGNHIATRNLMMGGYEITGLPSPSGASMAANRGYVDSEISSLSSNTVKLSGNQNVRGVKSFYNRVFLRSGTVPETDEDGELIEASSFMRLSTNQIWTSNGLQLRAGPYVYVDNYNDAGEPTGGQTQRPMVTFINMSGDPDNASITLGVNVSHPRNRSVGGILTVAGDQVNFARDIVMRRGGQVGGVPGGNIYMNGGRVVGIADPEENMDAVNVRTLTQEINNNTVTLTRNQTIAGTKTFSSAVRAPNFVTTSDSRLKTDIEDVDFSDRVAQLRPVTFRLKDGDRPSFGFIAQEVEELFPEAVLTNDEGFKAVDYSMMVSPLVSAVQDLQKQIDDLSEEIRALKDVQ